MEHKIYQGPYVMVSELRSRHFFAISGSTEALDSSEMYSGGTEGLEDGTPGFWGESGN